MSGSEEDTAHLLGTDRVHFRFWPTYGTFTLFSFISPSNYEKWKTALEQAVNLAQKSTDWTDIVCGLKKDPMESIFQLITHHATKATSLSPREQRVSYEFIIGTLTPLVLHIVRAYAAAETKYPSYQRLIAIIGEYTARIHALPAEASATIATGAGEADSDHDTTSDIDIETLTARYQRQCDVSSTLLNRTWLATHSFSEHYDRCVTLKELIIINVNHFSPQIKNPTIKKHLYCLATDSLSVLLDFLKENKHKLPMKKVKDLISRIQASQEFYAAEGRKMAMTCGDCFAGTAAAAASFTRHS